MEIIKEKETEYQKYVEVNDDPYSKCVVDCGEIFGKALDEGKTFDEAEQIMLDTEDGNELTGYMMGAIMSAITHFHPRGGEVKNWWNARYGVGADAKGTVNPAIITLKDSPPKH